ncbi:MAG: hypothetical protein ACM3WV_06215 [Bacillota bacterium]
MDIEYIIGVTKVCFVLASIGYAIFVSIYSGFKKRFIYIPLILILIGISFYFFSDAFRRNDVQGIEINRALRLSLFLFIATDIIAFFIQTQKVLKIKVKTVILTLASVLLIYIGYQGFRYIYMVNMIRQISQSHIQSNVPDKDDFDKILKRDLKSYFDLIYKQDVKVEYENLLGPVQVGIAYPKFYLWVIVYSKDKKIEEGSVYCAAIEKTKFEVRKYRSKEELKKDENILDSIFYEQVSKKIKGKFSSQE